MGVSGDMLMSSLLEVHPNPIEFLEKLNNLNIPNVVIKSEKSIKCGIAGRHTYVYINGEEEYSYDISHHHEHTSHTNMECIVNIISSLNIPKTVKDNAIEVYQLIAQAESIVHDRPVSEIHFHEVGTMDAIVDIVSVCWLIEEINPQQIICSPINVGSGQVRCSHGVLPIPAPATAHILRDIPIYNNHIQGELCTPTGSALIRKFVSKFGSMPLMCVEKIGYGMGSKDFPIANCLRVMLGNTFQSNFEKIIELSCNLDDMTPEQVAFATELLLNQGAKDVYTTSIQMKKGRLGILLTCMCNEVDREKFIKLIFKHTTTIGIREYTCNRYTLSRTIESISTQYGTVRVKKSNGFGIEKSKLEYDDISKVALKNDISLFDVM